KLLLFFNNCSYLLLFSSLIEAGLQRIVGQLEAPTLGGWIHTRSQGVDRVRRRPLYGSRMDGNSKSRHARGATP
ncbi:unnamed protein product, partial [Musa hybrid cultivar]